VLKATPVITWPTPADIVYGTALSATQLNATVAGIAGTFVYSPAAGTILNAGAAQTLSVTFTPTDVANYSSATAAVQINVLKATPVITWPTPADIVYGTALSATQLNATVAGIAGTFVYSPAAGTILNAGSAQTLSVTFTPDDAVNYTTATATVSINVLKATPVITWPTPADITYGTALSATQLNATVAGVAGTFVYSPVAGTILNAGAAQTLSVTFTPTDVANYASATATVQLNVVKATPVITWPTPAAITYGTELGAAQLNASANVPGTFSYSPAAGTVLNAGAAQTLSVTFTPTDAASYSSATATVSIAVLKAAPQITWATPADIVYGTALSPTQLNATANVPGTIAYAPAADTILNAGAAQTLSVSFTPTDAANYSIATASVQINVLKATPLVTWPTPADITYGTALSAAQLNATASVPGTFVYAPAAGTLLDSGTHSLSAAFTPEDAANYASATATVTIVVLKGTPTLSWAVPADITYGTALSTTQLNATVAGIAGSFVYTPAAGAILNAGAAQTLSVTFTPNDAGNYATATKTVALNVLKATPVVTWPAPADITYGTALGAAQLNATANVAGTFVYDPPAGTVLPAGVERILSVTFTPADAANYAPATATVFVTVLRASPPVSWTAPADITYGTPLGAAQLSATSTVPGTFAYSPAAGTILNAGAAQTLSVTFTPADSANYSTKTASVPITVVAATPDITWPAPADITYGTALGAAQLNATSTVPGTFAYSPAAGTILDAGSRSLAVTFTPTDAANYAARTATVTLTVLRATPAITWPAPADITYGTALSATQLNATASVAGTFVYTPAAGTVLNVGAAQALSVTFTPADAANYAAATATAALTVVKATPTITWPAPADISYGTALSATQLNATASVPGSFAYAPSAGAVLDAGAAQTLSVTFTPTDTAHYATKTATVSINVLKLTPSITWPAPADITYGTPLGATQLNATVAGIAGTFAYSPAAGTILTAGVNTLSVTFTPAATANYAIATRTVSITVSKATPVVTWAAPANIAYGTPLSSTQLNAAVGGSIAGTFAYTPAAGTILNAGPAQTLSVTFTPADTVNYANRTMTVAITVDKGTPVITWAPTAILYPGTLGTRLNAVVTDPATGSVVPGTTTYTRVTQSGEVPVTSDTVLPVGTSTLRASFTPSAAAAANLTGATKTVQIMVIRSSLEISWPAPGDVTYGTALDDSQLNATVTTTGGSLTAASVESGGSLMMAGASSMMAASPTLTAATTTVTGTFTYTVDGGQPARGRVLNAGVHTLTAVFTPSDTNYAPATKSVPFTVLKAQPSLTWLAPGEIVYGIALAQQHLTATANVPGTFSYSPPSGALLDEGQRTISVTFIPADRTNYTNAATSRSVNVVRPPKKPVPQPAFGFVETPKDGATGVSGSLGITGWVLDDTGVEVVQVFRDPIAGEGPMPIFIGNAAMVEGMRPDVQAAYATLPFAARAGWGYMLLTNMLPNGGNGTFRFHVYAKDFDGNTTLLGSRTVSCTNNASELPFGAIDTPGQGQIVSGVILNWGWALTPPAAMIPTSGATIDVVLDGVVVGHPTYGFDRPDVAGLFPGYANTHSGVGYFVIDTTTMSNGTHTLAWIVRDSFGRAEGIGSRFFTVRNEVPVGALPASVDAPMGLALPAASEVDVTIPGETASTAVRARTAPATIDAAARLMPIAIQPTTPERGVDARSTTAHPQRALVAEAGTTAARASLTLDVTTVSAGAAVTVTIANGPGGARDRVMFYSATAPARPALDWSFLNGERTAPSAGQASATVTLTAPSAPGRYIVRLMPAGASSAAATAELTVVPSVR
jgi:hypothetical protein